MNNLDGNVSSAVDRTLSPDDGMYQGNQDHYFSCGQSALRTLLAAVGLAGIESPKKILDFGAGAGRVTRWLRAAFPNSEIHGCDVREQDMAFLRSAFGIEAWTVGTDVHLLSVPGGYDLIWVGSVVTHLAEPESRLLINKLLSACNPNGLLVVSFHGECAIEWQENGYRYIHDEAWPSIKSGYLANGYGYADYKGQPGYGISVCSAARMIDLMRGMNHKIKIVLLSERAWDNHQDVIAVQKISSPPQS